MADLLSEKINLLPERPGVYLFKAAGGQVIYVGKAVSLRDRVRSYFRGGRHLTAKVLRLVAEISDLEHIVTDTEVEALILECNLIKRHRPRFNIRLRDDKNYPYLRVTVHEAWPRVMIARGIKNDGARYFGPFTQSTAVHETLRTLRRVFPYRNCSDVRFRQHRNRPCLHYDVKRCLGPCASCCSGEEYQAMIGQLVSFLEGKQDGLLTELRRRMEAAAGALEFERAAELRDKLRALEQVVEKQKMVSDRLDDQDVIALARDGPEACAQVFFVREGKLVGREAFVLAETEESGDGEVLGAFLKQYYAEAGFVPREVLVEALPEDAAAIEAWLSGRRGGRVFLRAPRRGEKRRLIEMVHRNAALFLEEERQRRRRKLEEAEEVLADLQRELGLTVSPRRIECYDISHIQGRQTVASMVVFEAGQPTKKEYRKFKIRTVAGPDDFAAMREVIFRRFSHTAPAADAAHAVPDLVIIDGGKGQLSAAREVMRTLGWEGIPTFGLAKEHEWLFGEGRPDPIVLPRDSRALYLVQRIRDEAHRFAVGYHRRLRSKETVQSLLEEIPGIGPKRRKALLTHFPSLDALRAADVEELAAVPGMTRSAAQEVYDALQGERPS